MARVIIAPIGEQLDNLFVGLRDFPADRVILLGDEKEAEQALSDLERFKIPTRVVPMEGDMWESLFEKISQINDVEKGNELIVKTVLYCHHLPERAGSGCLVLLGNNLPSLRRN